MNGADAATLATDHYPRKDDPSLLEADMVMKGGITSGVVYPWAVCELAKRYRFRNLGGTSAGGIAAAFAAAAEMNRDGGGLNRFAELPDDLGTNLSALFQPSKGTRALHGVLLAGIDPRTKGLLKARRVVWAAARAATGGLLLGTFVVFLPLFWSVLLAFGAPHDAGDWFAVAWRGLLVPFLVSVVVGGGAGIVVQMAWRGLKGMTANGYGLCRGSAGKGWKPEAPAKGAPVEPFTDWMHAALNNVAGFERGQVLTLGDLWGDPAVEAFDTCRGGIKDALRAAELAAEVRLEMMTTNVTHCRPERVPFESEVYLACLTELGEYFPPVVVDHLERHGRPALRKGEPVRCPEHGDPLLHLPEPPRFPVVMTIRMTLSFPGLISAVPLYAVDYDSEAKRPVRCWFSDGGVSSNFPIHFFDSLLPRRPTFAINLGPYHPERPDEDVKLHPPGKGVPPRIRDTESLPGFIAALLDTLQNWSDEGQAKLPGYRERVVDVHHHEDEGGMNLLMPKETIDSLSERGLAAAKALLDGFDFELHRWTRYLVAMSALDDAVVRMAGRWGDPGLDYRGFVRSYGATSEHYKQSGRWLDDAVGRTDTLLAFGGWKPGAGPGRRARPGPPPPPDFFDCSPLPRPDLRLTPHF